MYWETLPNWVWIIYYSFLLATLGSAISSIIRRKVLGLSIITVALTMTVPIISMLNSIGRDKGVNELEHIIIELQQGKIWSIYTIIGFLFLIVWWGIFLMKNKVKTETTH